MKALVVIALVAALGFVAYQQGVFTPAPPPPPPPPPPPAILSEPAPVISEEEMAKVLKSAADTDANVRWEAVVFLDKVTSPRAMPIMEEMLQKDVEPTLRIKIIDLLGTRRGDEILRALLGSLKDQEADVRLAALRALEIIGDYSVAGVIAGGPLHDQEESVRLQAMKLLNSLQDKRQQEIEAARQRYEAEKAAALAAQQKK